MLHGIITTSCHFSRHVAHVESKYLTRLQISPSDVLSRDFGKNTIYQNKINKKVRYERYERAQNIFDQLLDA